MTDPMLAFARARLDEDAAPTAVEAWHEPWCLDPSSPNSDGTCFYCGAKPDPSNVRLVPQPDRVLRAIAAKRLVVIEAAYWHDRTLASIDEPFPMPDLAGRFEVAYTMLRALLTEWDDHADYLPEWKP